MVKEKGERAERGESEGGGRETNYNNVYTHLLLTDC